MCKGMIFNIQKFSIHDGPGIRTTVFLKGCPLRCKWCANPESQLKNIQILCNHDRCLKCQTCLRHCPSQAIYFEDNKIKVDFHKCIGCLQCVDMCPVDALSHEGEYKTIDEIVEICKQDIDFYEESHGGVTISGGEGMSQPQFLKQLCKALKDNHMHIAIETTGYIAEDIFQDLAGQFDLLLFDVKHYDRDKHLKGTGVDNDLIKRNLKWAITNNIEVLPRIPVIPSFNDSLDDARGIAQLLNDVGAKKVQLLPFHQLGEKKYDLLNKEYAYHGVQPLHHEDLTDYKQIFIEQGLDCFI